MQAASPKARPKPMAPPAAPSAQKPQASPRPSSSSSSAINLSTKGAHPNTTAADGRGWGSGAAASAPPEPNPSLNGEASRSPLPPAAHPHLGAPPAPQLVPPSRPLLTVAAVEAVLAAIPPPPRYGLEDLDRRTVALSDGTVRTYFALPLEPPPQLRQPPPPLPAHLLAPPPPPPPLPLPPRLGPDRWALSSPGLLPPSHAPPGPLLPTPALKRKWDDQANGVAPVASLGRQPPLLPKPDERRVAKQVKVEVPAIDVKTLKSAFLKMVKVINQNEADKKNFRSNGKFFPLKCSVCKRDSVDLHALINHAYHAQSPEHRADHLGLHKALCVLMGWNYNVAPVHKTAYQSLSTADAEANQGDLILWPPTVIVENTYKSKNDGQRDGMSNNDMEIKLREMGFSGVDVHPLPGKDGQRSMLVKFPATLDGLNKASQLAQLFENEGHGRAAWAHIRSTGSTMAHPMLVKVDEKGERTWVLFGYLATAWDLDILDAESKQKAVIKSRKELDLD